MDSIKKLLKSFFTPENLTQVGKNVIKETVNSILTNDNILNQLNKFLYELVNNELQKNDITKIKVEEFLTTFRKISESCVKAGSVLSNYYLTGNIEEIKNSIEFKTLKEYAEKL